jgi:hypothetical protein
MGLVFGVSPGLIVGALAGILIGKKAKRQLTRT